MRLLPVAVTGLLLLSALPLPWGSGESGGGRARFVPPGLVVMFDEAHYPVYSVNASNPTGYDGSDGSTRGDYAAFAGVMQSDGFTIKTLNYGQRLSSSTLSGVRVLVIDDSQAQSRAGGDYVPYTDAEIDAIVSFVRNGGGLYIIGDHSDFPKEIEPIMARFSASMASIVVRDDDDFVGSPAGTPDGNVFIAFTREGGHFRNHTIMQNISRVEFYRTNTIDAYPPESIPLIVTDGDAYAFDPMTSTLVSVAGQPVALAIPEGGVAGAGRVALSADTNTFETDEDRDGDGDLDLYDSDNERYGLATVRWLAEIPERYGLNITSAEPDTLGTRQAVHRAEPDTTTVFNLTVSNLGNVADTFDLAVTSNQSWTSSLSYDVLTLESMGSTPLALSVTVPSSVSYGSAALFNVSGRSRGDAAKAASFLATVIVQIRRGVDLNCTRPNQTVDPGGTASYSVSVTNIGNADDTFAVSLDTTALPPGWGAAVEPSQNLDFLFLRKGASSVLRLDVAAPDMALGGTKGKVTMKAVSRADSAASDALATVTTVRQRFAFELNLTPAVTPVAPDGAVVFRLDARNLGNGDDRLLLNASIAAATGWSINVDPPLLALPYNRTANAAVTVWAPPLAAANSTAHITAAARSAGDPNATGVAEGDAVVIPVSRVTLNLTPPHQGALPGESVNLTLTAVNRGNADEVVEVSFGAHFVSASGANYTLAAGAGAGGPGVWRLPLPGGTVFYNITLPLGGRSDTALRLQLPPDAAAHDSILLSAGGVSVYNSSVTASATAQVEVLQRYLLNASASPDVLRIIPGRRDTFTVNITNRGNGNDMAVLDPVDVPVGWSGGTEAGGAATTSVPLPVGASSGLAAWLVPPAGALTGMYNLTLNFSDGGGNWYSLPLPVEVLPAYDFEITSLQPAKSARPGATVTFTVTVTSLSNAPDTVNLSITPLGMARRWGSLGESVLVLKAGESREVSVRVVLPQDVPAWRFEFRVEGASAGNSSVAKNLTLAVKVKPGGTSIIDPFPLLLLIILIAVSSYLAYRYWRSKTGLWEKNRPGRGGTGGEERDGDAVREEE